MSVKYLKLSAPGKLILCGEHSVVYGKKALASAIDLRTHLNATRCDVASLPFELILADVDRFIRINSNEFACTKNTKSSYSFVEAMEMLMECRQSDADKPVEAVKFLIMTVPGLKWSHLESLKVEIRSDIPLASGLGSSASFSVCLSTLFLLISESIRYPFTVSDLDRVNSFAFALERIFHGQPSGIDNSVACYGHYAVFEKGSVIDKFASSIENLPILIINSCVPKQTSEQVSKVRTLRTRHTDLVDGLMNSIHSIVDEFVQVLKTSQDTSLLNDLVTLNQGILHGFQVNTLELATIVGLAAKFGFHAKLTGSGGGGCCFAILFGDDVEDRLARLVDEFKKLNFISFRTKLGCNGINIENIEYL